MMTAKRAALLAWLVAELDATEAGFRGAERVELGAHLAGTVKARKDAMGDPIRFVEVLYLGPGSGDAEYGSEAMAGAHRFHVRVRYQYADTAENQAAWDAMLEGESGVLRQLRQEGLALAGGAYRCARPEGVQVFFTDIDFGADIFAHECTFELNIL